MKLSLLFLSLTFFITLVSSQAHARYRFCLGESQHQGIMCSFIDSVSSYGGQRACFNWAQDNGVSYRGFYTDYLLKRLQLKQLEVCDFLPGFSKWSCFVIENCGTSSSIGPIGVKVFAPIGQVEQARDNCVNIGWAEYKQRLINVTHGCTIAPDAAELSK